MSADDNAPNQSESGAFSFSVQENSIFPSLFALADSTPVAPVILSSAFAVPAEFPLTQVIALFCFNTPLTLIDFLSNSLYTISADCQ